jgi:hypothetical protein
MVQTPSRKSRIPPNIITPLILCILAVCVVVAGCNSPFNNQNTTAAKTPTPTVTPSLTKVTTIPLPQTTVPNSSPTGNKTPPEVQKGLLNITVGDYSPEPPATVFIDNVSAGTVAAGKPLNLTVTTGRHAVRACIVGACFQDPVVVLISEATELDYGDRFKNEIVTGPLVVSIGGYVAAELPVFVDNTLVGNVSNDKPLTMKAAEGNHTIKICVGILCVNDTAVTKFAQPVYLDFGKRLKGVMEFSTPTIRIIDTSKNNNRVVVSVEFINPTKKDLSMAATVRVAYSYIAPSTRYREANAVQSDLTRTVKAGNRTVQNVTLTLTGGSTYISEIPTILDSSFT